MREMEIKKCWFLLIPELSKKYYFIILFLIGSFFRKCIPCILSDYFFNLNNNIKDNEKNDEERLNNQKKEKYFDLICNISSDVLTGIIHCYLKRKEIKDNENIYKYRNNINNINDDVEIKKNETNILNIYLIHNDEKPNNSLLFKIIFIISSVDFICQLGFYFSCIANQNQPIFHNIDYLYSFLVIDIVSKYIFSKLVLGTHFYFHHYFSIFLNIIILLLLFILELKYKIKEYDTPFLILSVIQYVLYSLEDILNKLALKKLKGYIFPESILFYKGLFTLVYFLIFSLIIFPINDIDINIDFNEELVINIFIRIVFIIFNILRSVFLVEVIHTFSEQHMSLLKVLESIILSIYYIIDRLIKNHLNMNHNYFKTNNKDNNNKDNNTIDIETIDLIEIMVCLLLLIISLIHNEIIIINCNKFKKNTKYNLLIESEKEIISSIKDNLDGNIV